MSRLTPEQKQRVKHVESMYCHSGASGDKAFLVGCIRTLEQELAASRAATLREAAAAQENAIPPCLCGGREIHDESCPSKYPSAYRSKTILALIDPAAQSALDRERAEARLDEAEWWEKFFNTIAPPHYRTQRLAALRQSAGVK